MDVKIRLWFEENERVFGKGPYDLLQGVDQWGSLRQAAKQLQMSYSKAHQIIRRAEGQLGYELLTSVIGGEKGGGSTLTSAARLLMRRFEYMQRESQEVLNELVEKWDQNIFRESLRNLVSQDPTPQLAMIGGGGKTSLLEYLFEILHGDYRVLYTSTTAMMKPEGIPLDLGTLSQERNSRAFFQEMVHEKKVKGVKLEVLDEIKEQFDFILCEADGSNRLPIKVYADYEPPIPQRTDLVFIIYGMDALGKAWKEVVHRAALMGEDEKIFDEDDILKLFQRVSTKNIPQGARIVIFLNKADMLTTRPDFTQMARTFFQHPQVEALMVGSIQHRRMNCVFGRDDV